MGMIPLNLLYEKYAISVMLKNKIVLVQIHQ